jgi:two-component system, OmpR family, sensor histidine kinase ChvG
MRTGPDRPDLRFGLRGQLMFSAGLLLFIPLLGYQYVRELERLLLNVQEQGLVSTARAVGTALNDRPNVFLSGEVYPFALAQDRDLRIENLAKPITLDGSTNDWAEQTPTSHPVGSALGSPEARAFSARYRIGRYGNFIYALFEVSDPKLILRDPDQHAISAADHLQISVVTPDEEFRQFIVSAKGSGPLNAFVLDADSVGVPDTRITGIWRVVPGGYVVELRLPRSLIGPRLGFAVANVDNAQTRTLTRVIGTSDTQSKEHLGAVLVPSPEVTEIVRGLGRSRSRIWVVDVNRRVIAHAGTLHVGEKMKGPESGPLERAWEFFAGLLFRPLLRLAISGPNDDFQDVAAGTYRVDGPDLEDALAGHTGTRWRLTTDARAVVLSAAHPVWSDNKVVGAVMVEETTNDVLATRNRAFEKLFAALLAVYLGGTAMLLVFATRLSSRIRRLRDGAEQAIDEHGRVLGMADPLRAGDELGDLSRSFSAMLARLKQYTGYLEHLAGRLSHELRTPVAVVRSSLDNLKLVALPDEARVYVQRAEEGLSRLTRIFVRMSEATRLEHTLSSAEREHFDLAQVVRGCVEGYRLAHPGRQITLEAGEKSLPLFGAPDLIAQMLDKLIANALEFSNPSSAVLVRLFRDDNMISLQVLNEGPPLPADMKDRLFESMVSVRPAQYDAEPHLGLGLYIVRLIAEFHGALASADNREDAGGVVINVRFPATQSRP